MSERRPNGCCRKLEAALDSNSHLIAELGGEVPEEHYGAFLEVAEHGDGAPFVWTCRKPSRSSLHVRPAAERGVSAVALTARAAAVGVDLGGKGYSDRSARVR